MKEGSLFCFGSYEIHLTGICFRSCSWCLWKALDKEGGVHGLGSIAFGAKVLE
jgi:hypothetical protein